MSTTAGTATVRVFLSASMPPTDLVELRMREDAWEDLYRGYPTEPREVEAAVCGIVPHLLRDPRRRLVFGGHPLITPIITEIGRLEARPDDDDASERRADVGVEIFQSAFFAGQEKFHRGDEVVYSHIRWTPICRPDDDGRPVSVSEPFVLGEHPLRGSGEAQRSHQVAKEQLDALDESTQNRWRRASLAYMRGAMIEGCDLAIFIGGMEGISLELAEFERRNPGKPVWLVTRPGGRTDRIAHEKDPASRPAHWHVEESASYDLIGYKIAQAT